jgi:hypothetical protein
MTVFQEGTISPSLYLTDLASNRRIDAEGQQTRCTSAGTRGG